MEKILTDDIPLEFFKQAILDSNLIDPTVAVSTSDFYEHSERMALISTMILESSNINLEEPYTFQNIIEDYMSLIRFKRAIYRLMSDKTDNLFAPSQNHS